jgi:CRISPR-associated protein Cas2
MVEWSAYRGVWALVMFDLPVDTKEARKRYTDFRKALLEDGFTRMQFSVYMRYCASEENAEAHFKRVQKSLPPMGEVRIIQVTDKQFERMKIFHGKLRKKVEEKACQLEFF